MQIYRLQKWSLALLFLLLVLSVRLSSLKAQQIDLDKCMEYFTEILEVQKFRQMLQHGADEMIRRYENGHLTKKELDATLAVWHNTESELRQKVTKLYDTAYTEKCFEDESKRTPRRNAP